MGEKYQPTAEDISNAEDLLEELELEDDEDLDDETLPLVDDENAGKAADKAPREKGAEGDGKGNPQDGGEGKAADEDQPQAPQDLGVKKAVNPFVVPADFDAQVEAANTQMSEIDKKWDDGDIGDADYKKGVAEVAAKLARLEALKASSDTWIIQQAAAERAADDARWADTVSRFKAANPALWSDEHKARFGAHVRAVTGNEANANLSFDDQIALAAGLYSQERVAMGHEAVAFTRGKATADGKSGRGRPALPPTLGGKPNAAPIDVGSGAFAAVDADDDADASEEALMRMTPAQREAYLQGKDLV